MKRISKVTAFLLIATFVLSFGFTTVTAADYSNHWAKDAIDFVVGNGYWTEEGDFQPDKSITRAEFSALLTRTLKAVVLDIIPPFDDVNLFQTFPHLQFIKQTFQLALKLR